MSRSILIISITTLITIIIWTSFDIVHGMQEKQLSEDIQNNTIQQIYTFNSDKTYLKTLYAKSSTIKYTRDQLNGIK